MGLDMYLTAERYLWDFDNHPDKAKAEQIAGLFPELKGKRVKRVVSEVGYWRKANQIHNWFVKHCQDEVDECQQTHVGKEKLEQLLDSVNKVLADKQLAGELLPAATGFFFGSTEYNEWYFQDLEQTKTILEDALEMMKDPGWDFYYQSSW